MTPTQIMQRRVDAIDQELRKTMPVSKMERLIEERSALVTAMAMVDTGDLQPDD